MCGIAGIFRFNRPGVSAEDAAALGAMGDAQRHRGPDDAGQETFGRCALSSQRLSILDLSAHGHMPMRSEDGSLALVQNGEIYNYVELRAELRALGHAFRSEGDTEVILRAYQQWGPRCVERFVGMWAFALYDGRSGSLFLSRDRFGIKPLYVHQTLDRLVFASEIKAIVAYLRHRGERVAPNHASIATYAVTGLVDGLPDTFFEGIRRFPAASRARVSRDGVEMEAYWSLPQAAASLRATLHREARTDAALIRRVRDTLAEAVRVHLRSDVPVGVCLSGGLDSSAVVALASESLPSVKTFTVYFDGGPEYDERPHAAVVVRQLKAEGTERRVSSEHLLETLGRIVWHLDEPSLAPGVFPQWHVMALAREQVKVVLDGQGGDEIFAGYTNYLPQHLYGAMPWSPAGLLGDVLGTARLYGAGRATAVARNALAMRLRTPAAPRVEDRPDAVLLDPELRRLADVSNEEWRLLPKMFDDWLTNVLYWEVTRTRLPALLRYEDRLSMAFSIESRVPFLDHRLVELAFALPGALKIRGGWSKWVVRKALDDLLPESVVWRRDKKGFPTPLSRWLRDGSGAEARALLRSGGRRSAALFPSCGLEPLIAAHESGRGDHSALLWRALSTEVWMQAYAL